jgi:hypothetical protein
VVCSAIFVERNPAWKTPTDLVLIVLYLMLIYPVVKSFLVSVSSRSMVGLVKDTWSPDIHPLGRTS